MLGFSPIGATPLGVTSTDPPPDGVVISALPGTADASGARATISSSLLIAAQAAIAIASGATANISTLQAIAANPGVANAAGAKATIVQACIIMATPGTADAIGGRAILGRVQVITCSVGLAYASGGQATVVQTVVEPPADAVFPDPSTVMAGVQYGPTGGEFTGTLVPVAGSNADEIATAVWSDPRALDLIKFLAYKDQ